MQCRTARTRNRRRLAYRLQQPWREYPRPRGRGQVPVLGPGTTNDRELHTRVGSELLPVRDLLELVQARGIGGVRSEVVDENAAAAPLELLRQKESRRFLGDVGIRLVGDA